MAETALATRPAASPPVSAPEAPRNLDELMLAMDVVDTLRHEENLVTRELDETRREAQLIERLRDLYRGQGIEVPDRVLREGVQALAESRFVYTPPAPGLGTKLAKAWVNRDRFGKGLIALVAAAALGWGAYQIGVVRPAEQRTEKTRLDAERTRIELTERLPQALRQGHAEVLAEAQVEPARVRANQILADGRAALARRDAPAAQQAIADLEALRADLRREFTLRIVSRPGDPSGVFRVPDRNRGARNYYLVVEPVTSDGRVLSLPITSEEDASTKTVNRWGLRVSEAVYNEIRRDKTDDGIVQKNRAGEKRRGQLDIEYAMPVLGGAITQW